MYISSTRSNEIVFQLEGFFLPYTEKDFLPTYGLQDSHGRQSSQSAGSSFGRNLEIPLFSRYAALKSGRGGK
jgi:hypothetical protein